MQVLVLENRELSARRGIAMCGRSEHDGAQQAKAFGILLYADAAIFARAGSEQEAKIQKVRICRVNGQHYFP